MPREVLFACRGGVAKIQMRDDDYIFFPEVKDADQRERVLDVTMIQLLKRANFPPEYIYAWHKCGFFHPDIVNSFRRQMGEPPLRNLLTKSEIKQWGDAVKEYREKGGEIPVTEDK